MDIKHSSGGERVFTPKTDHLADSDSLCSELCKINKTKNAVYPTPTNSFKVLLVHIALRLFLFSCATRPQWIDDW